MYVCIYYLLILLSFDTDVIYNWQTNNVVITSIPIWIVSTINSKHKLWVTFIQVGLFLLSHSASVGARSRRGVSVCCSHNTATRYERGGRFARELIFIYS